MTTELVALRMPKTMHDAIKAIAKARRWSQSRAIVILLESALQAQRPEDAGFRLSTSADCAAPGAAIDRAEKLESAEQSRR